jgi:hypothetical protein
MIHLFSVLGLAIAARYPSPPFVQVVAGPNSCEGHCGSWASNCWCNDQCESRGNCCSDYQQQCGGPAPGPGPSPPGPSPVGTQLRILSKSAYPDAKCLDGSQGGYYFRNASSAANSNKYLFFFEGGGEHIHHDIPIPNSKNILVAPGWCYDTSCASPTDSGTLQNCRSRSAGTTCKPLQQQSQGLIRKETLMKVTGNLMFKLSP